MSHIASRRAAPAADIWSSIGPCEATIYVSSAPYTQLRNCAKAVKAPGRCQTPHYVLISSASGCVSTGWAFVCACPAYPQCRYLLKHSCVLQHISVCCPRGLTPSGFSFEYVHSPGSCQSWALLFPLNIKLLSDKTTR